MGNNDGVVALTGLFVAVDAKNAVRASAFALVLPVADGGATEALVSTDADDTTVLFCFCFFSFFSLCLGLDSGGDSFGEVSIFAVEGGGACKTGPDWTTISSATTGARSKVSCFSLAIELLAPIGATACCVLIGCGGLWVGLGA